MIDLFKKNLFKLHIGMIHIMKKNIKKKVHFWQTLIMNIILIR